MPKREADIWDWSKTITPVQEKLIIALAIEYEMYVVDPVIGNSGKEDLTYNQHFVYNHHQRSVSELTNMNKTFLSGAALSKSKMRE